MEPSVYNNQNASITYHQLVALRMLMGAFVLGQLQHYHVLLQHNAHNYLLP